MYYPTPILQPNVVKQVFNGKERECIVVVIEGKEYEECERAAQGNNFWGNSKPGAYGAGLGKEEGDEFKPARTGLLGQMAFAKLTQEPVDTVYRKGGDKQDNLIGTYKFDMKCSMKKSGDSLIYHTNEWGKKIPLDKDIYVCSYIQSEDRAKKTATVVVVGFALQKDVQDCKVEPGRKGNGHMNYVVEWHTLRSIVGLVNAKKKYFGTKEKV